MWATIGAIIQLIFLVFKNKFEKDEQKRKEKDALSKEASVAIKSGNVSLLNSIIGKLRK